MTFTAARPEGSEITVGLTGTAFSHWGQGGTTDADKLVLLCYRHHWMIHEGGWQLAKVERGLLLAIPPSPAHRSWIRAPAAAADG